MSTGKPLSQLIDDYKVTSDNASNITSESCPHNGSDWYIAPVKYFLDPEGLYWPHHVVSLTPYRGYTINPLILYFGTGVLALKVWSAQEPLLGGRISR